MPAQSPLPERQHRDLGLIETMLWTREPALRSPLHLQRLSRSAALRFPVMIEEVVAAIQAAVADSPEGRLRLRLIVKSDGGPTLAVTPEPVMPEGAIWRVAIADGRLDPADPLIRRKTTARQHYDEARAIATAGGAEEALFLNGAGEVCEGAITSVFVERAGVLLTPALACGLPSRRAAGEPHRLGKGAGSTADARRPCRRLLSRQCGARARSGAARRLSRVLDQSAGGEIVIVGHRPRPRRDRRV